MKSMLFFSGLMILSSIGRADTGPAPVSCVVSEAVVEPGQPGKTTTIILSGHYDAARSVYDFGSLKLKNFNVAASYNVARNEVSAELTRQNSDGVQRTVAVFTPRVANADLSQSKVVQMFNNRAVELQCYDLGPNAK